MPSSRLRVYAGRDPINGKDRSVSREFHGNKKAAEVALAVLVTEVSRGSGTGATTTLYELLCAFLVRSKRIGRSPTTLREYQRMTRVLGRGSIGSCQTHRLSPKHLDDLHGRVAEEGIASARTTGPLSAASINRYHDLIKAACEQAVRWGWIPFNPAERATPPTELRRKVPPPTPEQLRSLIDAASRRDPGRGVLIAVAAATGCRRGEPCALR